jgi:hypothetical protein
MQTIRHLLTSIVGQLEKKTFVAYVIDISCYFDDFLQETRNSCVCAVKIIRVLSHYSMRLALYGVVMQTLFCPF